MQRARALDDSHQSVPDRGAEVSAPRSTPLTLVAGAVAGDDLRRVATTVADALSCPVAIAIPALGEAVVAPPDSLTTDASASISAHAVAVAAGQNPPAPAPLVEAVTVRIGEQVVGIVAAAAGASDPGPEPASRSESDPERRAWLDAAAAAASVTALIREADATGAAGSGEALLARLAAGPPDDLPRFLVRARRLGLDLAAGAVAICVRSPPDGDRHPLRELASAPGILVAELRGGRILALAELSPDGGGLPGGWVARLRDARLTVAVSTPRRDPSLLHEAVREAELLAELGGGPELPSRGHDETYRLLIGVLLRDRGELQQLRDQTITPLADYDTRHDTELLATLRAFLAHDGSTTETAEAMALHRHTVGYRLARVHEVSGLSPYESDGRERLSLGLKAQQILEAEHRLHAHHDGPPKHN